MRLFVVLLVLLPCVAAKAQSSPNTSDPGKQDEVTNLLYNGDVGCQDCRYYEAVKPWWTRELASIMAFKTYFKSKQIISDWCRTNDCIKRIKDFCAQYGDVDRFMELSIDVPAGPAKLSIKPAGFCKQPQITSLDAARAP